MNNDKIMIKKKLGGTIIIELIDVWKTYNIGGTNMGGQRCTY